MAEYCACCPLPKERAPCCPGHETGSSGTFLDSFTAVPGHCRIATNDHFDEILDASSGAAAEAC